MTGDHAAKAYPLRQFVAYRRLIEQRQRIDPDRAVDEYARANPDVDLEVHTTFAEWRGGSHPGDTAVRPGGFRVPRS